MSALHSRFKLPGDEGGAASTANKGKRARNNEGEEAGILYTQEGVDVAEALKVITVTLGHMDMRTRSLEAATYITVEIVPDNEFVVEALKGTKEFNEMIAKANRERWTKVMKKEIGGPSLYVAYKWLALIGAKHMSKINEGAKTHLMKFSNRPRTTTTWTRCSHTLRHG